MGRTVRSAVVVGLLGLLAACAEQGTPAADGQSSETPQAATETSEAAPAAGCPAGTYQVGSITAKDSVAVGGQQVQVAEVNGLTLAFTEDGGWELTGEGATISVSASGLSASATLDGTATGSYAKTGDTHVFTQESANGQITLDQPVAGINSIPMSEFGPAIAPSGTATITCTESGATISAENASLELTGGGSGGSGETGAAPAEPTEAEPAGKPAPAVINSSGQTAAYNCTGGPVTINGSNNNLTFTGTCAAANINGDSNEITIASVAAVNLNGSQNQLTWTDNKPAVNNNGQGNTISQG